jgi:hypothetical protein
MSVGGIRGGGGKGRAGGPRGATGKGGVAKASGKGFGGKVDKAGELVGPSGEVASGNVGQVDPVTAQALELARKLKSGEISSREEATQKLVADILKEKLRMQSKALTTRIADALADDPRLTQALERLWTKG